MCLLTLFAASTGRLQEDRRHRLAALRPHPSSRGIEAVQRHHEEVPRYCTVYPSTHTAAPAAVYHDIPLLIQPCRNTTQPRPSSPRCPTTPSGRSTASGRGSARPRCHLRTRTPSGNTFASEPTWSAAAQLHHQCQLEQRGSRLFKSKSNLIIRNHFSSKTKCNTKCWTKIKGNRNAAAHENPTTPG